MSTRSTNKPEFPPLINAEQLQTLLAQTDCRLFDCRFNLMDPAQGRQDWLAGHIPGAAYADLDQDLAGPVSAQSGRHPLPSAQDFAAFLARNGWVPGMPVVAYDAQGGAFAARLWWLMRYFGQARVAVLDGGLGVWQAAGQPLERGETQHAGAPVTALEADMDQVLSAADVAAGLAQENILLLDARDAGRFAGNNETIDPVAGHVPGAHNRPFAGNLDEQGRFRDPDALRAAFETFTRANPGKAVVHMCGSGVTACHNQLAMIQAGLDGGRLYAGSWSEWIRDPARPVSPEPDSR